MIRRFFSYLRRRLSFFSWTIAILNLTTLSYILAIIFIFLYALTDVNPYINLSKGSKLGMVDFERGVPVPVRFMSGYLPDSTFYGQSSHGSWSYSGSYSKSAMNGMSLDSINAGTHVDTVATEFKIWHGQSITDNTRDLPAHIKDGYVLSGILHIETHKKGWRLLLVLPMILSFSLFAFGARQLARLLRAILSGAAFTDSNYRRLRNIGWGIIAWQSILFILQAVFFNWTVLINFNSTTPDFHSPFSFSVAYQYDLSFYWVIAGSMLLILAYAFRKGNQLQKEQDLTV